MKSVVKKLALGMATALVLALGMAGCNSQPAATPIDKRAPGQDITPQARADKRGDAAPADASTGK
jgi:hypothetical protein